MISVDVFGGVRSQTRWRVGLFRCTQRRGCVYSIGLLSEIIRCVWVCVCVCVCVCFFVSLCLFGGVSVCVCVCVCVFRVLCSCGGWGGVCVCVCVCVCLHNV